MRPVPTRLPTHRSDAASTVTSQNTYSTIPIETCIKERIPIQVVKILLRLLVPVVAAFWLDGLLAAEILPAVQDVAPAPGVVSALTEITVTFTKPVSGVSATDLLVGGNFYGVSPVIGRYDASYGLMLRGGAEGRLVPVDIEESNLVIEGQVRDLKALRGPAGERLIAVARNNDKLEILRLNPRRR